MAGSILGLLTWTIEEGFAFICMWGIWFDIRDEVGYCVKICISVYFAIYPVASFLLESWGKECSQATFLKDVIVGRLNNRELLNL